jgi:adenosylcobinamide-GDP ribazoletransferase
VRSLWLAVQFLTVAPTPLRGPVSTGELGRSLAWYPLVGAGLGLLVGGVTLAARLTGAPAEVSAALAVALGLALTGGLHFDGLLDTCDGVFSRRSPEERLAIMRDPRVGSFGVAGGVCILLLKFAALATLPADRLVAATTAALALGRAAMVGAAILAPHGRADGLGARMTGGAGRPELAIAIATGIAIALAAGGVAGALWALAAGLLSLLLVRWLLTRLPGLTGDTYGALNEVTEAAVLALAAWRGLTP